MIIPVGQREGRLSERSPAFRRRAFHRAFKGVCSRTNSTLDGRLASLPGLTDRLAARMYRGEPISSLNGATEAVNG